MKILSFGALAAVCSMTSAMAAQEPAFALKNGDRVAFYGDSITDNSPYTYYIEAFVVTRYPKLDVSFVNAAMGGDRVTGGGLGPIDLRLTRDLFSRRPTVITSMLGMNDASYKPFDQTIFDTYQKGYQHIVDRIKKEAPRARVVLIRPSAFDDVNQAPGWDPGYNSVLIKYGDFVQQLASQNGFSTVDLNAPLVDMLTKAKGIDAEHAKQILPDRVHPSPAGHLILAEGILKGWNASSIVSKTTIDWPTGQSTVENGSLKDWKDGAFTLTENCLPFPVDRGNPLIRLVLASSDFDQALDQENLIVSNMPAGDYALKIDGQQVGKFSDQDFARGVNLATLFTPMMKQAVGIFQMTGQIGGLRYNCWRSLEVAVAPGKERDDAIKSLYRLVDKLEADRKKAAQPQPHKFEIVKAG